MRTLIAIFLLSIGAFAQTTAVTATITDSDGQAWLNGTYQISFLPTYGVAGPYSWNGGQPFTQFFSGSMNGSGALSVNLPSNNFISPALSKWVFQLCSNTSATCSSVAVSVTGATANLSSVLSAAVAAPRFGPGPTAFGYSDIEVGTPAAPVAPGAFYWNVISLVQRVWNGVSWQNGGGNGASCAPPTPAITYFNGSISVCDPNASLDGNGNLSVTSVTASGTISGNRVATNGSGGILDLQMQTPPVTIPANHAYVYANSVTGYLDCLNNSGGHCIGVGPSGLPLNGATSGNATLQADPTNGQLNINNSVNAFSFFFNGNSSAFCANRNPNSGAIGLGSGAAFCLIGISSTQYRMDIYNSAGTFLGSPLTLTGSSVTTPNLIATGNVQGATSTLGAVNKTQYVDGVANTTIAGALTALGGSDGTVVVPAGTYTLSSSLTVGSTTQQVQLTLQRGAVVNVTETDSGTAIKLGKYSKLYCEQGATVNVAATAILSDVVANLTQDSTQEAAYVEGCYFNIVSGATVSGAVIHFKRLYANSSIRHVVIVSPPHYGWWLDAGIGGGLGISNITVFDSWVTAGSAIAGSVACAITGSNGSSNISVSASQCEHSGLYDIYLDGLGGSLLGAVHHVSITGTGVESVTGQTGPHVYIRDSHDITIDTMQESGVSTNDMFQLSQSAAGLTYNIHLRNIASNETTGNLVNNTINSFTIPLSSTVQARNSYDFSGFAYQDTTTTLGSGLVLVGNKVFVTADFTLAANTSLQTITGLTWTLPANQVVNASFHCSLNYSQATANVPIAFGIQGATVTPTRIGGNGTLYTSTTVFATGTLNALTTTTATNIVSGTPSAFGPVGTAADIFKVELDGTVQEPSNASQPVINIMASTSNSADLVTIYQDSWCALY